MHSVTREVLDQRPGLDSTIDELLRADERARDLAGARLAALARS